MSFFGEFRRRNVPQVAIAYLAGAWLLIQVAETLLPIFGQSEDAARPLVVALAIGFIPALILAWVFEWTPQGIRRDAGVTIESQHYSTKGFDRAIIVLLVLAVGYFAIDKFVLSSGPTAPQDHSIIVLPFTNMSSDSGQEFFGEGMTEDLLNLLSKIDELRVISRSTAWTFKGREVGVAELHNTLDVSHVLEGSVRKSGNQVRVTAQLIDARTDAHLWSETYDEQLDDIFAIQDRISAQIVNELKIELLGDMPVAREIDSAAYELFLRARYIQRSGNWAASDETIAMLEKALEIEPDYVPALYELALIIYLSADSTSDAQEKMQSRVRNIVEKMAEILPDSSYANAWQSYIASEWDGDVEAAALHLERAIADDPHNPSQVLTRTASLLATLGRANEAYAVARYNAVRDPACTICATMMGHVARRTGHYEEAAEYLEDMLAWQPMTANFAWQLGAAWLTAGDPEKALKQFDYLIDESHSMGKLGRVMALFELGRMDEFETEFAAFREAEPDSWESIARIYAWTGQNDAAFRYLESMIEAEGPEVADYAKSAMYARLSTDPRYDEFLEKYGVADSDYSHIEFSPPYPPAMRAEIERLLASIETE